MAINIETVGPALIEQLWDKKMLRNSADLYILGLQELSKLNRMGEKSARNVLSNIDRSKNCELPQFVFAIGIPNVGERTASILAKNFGSLEKIMFSNVLVEFVSKIRFASGTLKSSKNFF